MVCSPDAGHLRTPLTTRRPPALPTEQISSSIPTSSDRKDTNVAVKLRLMRMGKKKQPTYRIVAADARSPRNGRFIEIVGTYDPRPDPSEITIDNEKAVDWLRKGAQPTERVEKLLKVTGAWDEFKGTTPSAPAAAEGDA
jgi:small subunit ribosomal protein S16